MCFKGVIRLFSPQTGLMMVKLEVAAQLTSGLLLLSSNEHGIYDYNYRYTNTHT